MGVVAVLLILALLIGGLGLFLEGLKWGSPDEHVGQATFFSAARSWGSLRSIGPAASMTRARAASAEWNP